MTFLQRLRFFQLGPALQFLAIVLISSGTTAGVMGSRISQWLGVWHQTGQALADSLALLAPLSAFFAGLAAQAFHRNGMAQLSDCAAQPKFLVLAREIARPYTAIIAGFGLVAALAYGGTAWLATAGSFSPAHLASILGLIAAAALVGFFLGTRIRNPIAPLAAFLVVLLGHSKLSVSDSLHNLTPGDSTGNIMLYRPSLFYFLQFGLYLGLALSLLFLLTRLRLLSSLPLSFAVGCTVVLLSLGEDPYRPVPTAEALQCHGTEVEICLPKILSFQDKRIRQETASVLRLTQALHPGGVKLSYGQQSIEKSPSGKLIIPVVLPARNNEISTRFERVQFLHTLIPSLLGGQGCSLSSAGPGLSLTGEVSLWLMRTEGALPEKGTYWSMLPPQYASSGLAQALAQADPGQTQAWLARNRSSLAECGTPVGNP